MVQVPVAVRVTVLPETLQAPEPVKVTARPEEALALTLNGESARVRSGRPVKVIVWLACVTWKDWLTSGAAR
jgi:hypothetical protein